MNLKISGVSDLENVMVVKWFGMVVVLYGRVVAVV
jgi:hypothetical protein